MFFCFPILINSDTLKGIILIKKACLLLGLHFSRICTELFFLLGGLGTQEMWEEQLPVKTEAEKLLTTSVFSMAVVTRSPILFIKGGGAKSA